MKLALKHVLAAVLLVLNLIAPATADPFGHASAAYERGDYTAAINLFLGLMYERQINTEAVEWRRLAAEGNAAAEFVLGLMYDDGKGDLLQNNTEAVKWYRLAADQGFALAQCWLGIMYDAGKGVPQDYAEAAKWFRLAADQGFGMAQYDIGYMYAFGQGVERNYVVAHMWFNLSAARGDEKAAELRDQVARYMTPAQIADAQKLARQWEPTTQPPR